MSTKPERRSAAARQSRDALNEILSAAIFRDDNRQDAGGKYGRLAGEVARLVPKGKSISAAEMAALIDEWERGLSDRDRAVIAIVDALRGLQQHAHVAASSEAVDLCQLLIAAVSKAGGSDGVLVEAFVNVLARGVRRIENPKRAKARHAPQQAALEEAWRHFKRGGYQTLAEGARAVANHQRASGGPSYRTVYDYFRQRRQGEGAVPKPGRPKKAASRQ